VPRVSEFERSGRLVFDAVLGAKYQSYRAFRLPWSGLPAEAPAIAVSRDGRARMTAYASWNGATGVKAWRLLAGRQATTLLPVSSTSARSFESAMHSTSAGPFFAVQALDASGAALGQSQTISIV
jgi:hypothetical protein